LNIKVLKTDLSNSDILFQSASI